MHDGNLIRTTAVFLMVAGEMSHCIDESLFLSALKGKSVRAAVTTTPTARAADVCYFSLYCFFKAFPNNFDGTCENLL